MNIIKRLLFGNKTKSTPGTVKAFLQSIPDRGIRKKALRNLDPKFADYPASSITHALSLAFIYRETKEGENFWSDVHFKYA